MGGGFKGYAGMMAEAREQAFERMMDLARVGADAVIGIRSPSPDVMGAARDSRLLHCPQAQEIGPLPGAPSLFLLRFIIPLSLVISRILED